MIKRWQAGLLVVAILATALVLKREPIAMAWFASKIEKTTLDQRIDLIKDFVEIRLPETGDGPYPVVVQLHGCAGIRPAFQHQWADVANKAGYAAMIVDSTGARGFSRDEALKIVCAGKALIGQERAGDIAAALAIAARDERLDASRIVLAGWSHGAWTAMDYLTMDAAKHPLPGISGLHPDLPEVTGSILFYPYCGVGTLSRFKLPAHPVKTLALIAGADEIVDASLCIRYFENQQRKGADIDMKVYPTANHVFDDPFLEPDYIHWFNEDDFNDATERVESFLSALK